MHKLLFHILFRKKNLLILFLLLQVTGSIAGALQPLYIQKFVSGIVSGLENNPLDYMPRVFFILAALYLFGVLAQGWSSYVMTILSARTFEDVRIAFFKKTSRLPIAYFRNESQGEFISKFSMDLNNIERLLSETIPMFFFNLLTVGAVLVILTMKCDTSLVVAGVLIAVVSSILVVALNKLLAKLAGELRQNYTDIHKIFDETIQGIDTLKVFVSEEQQLKKFKDSTGTFKELSIKSGRISSFFSAAINGVLQYGNLLVLIIIYFMIRNKNLDLDSFLLFFFYITYFLRSFNTMINAFMNFQPTLVSLKRIDSLFREQEEPASPDASKEHLPINKAEIKIEDLTFSYNSGKPVFENAHAYIGHGETVLIEGPSGSGKTTLLNLLLGFFKPNGGRILIDGKNIHEYPLSFLRDIISVLTQDYFIFEKTLRENIILAKPEATDPEVLEAIGKASLNDWYRSLPNGLDSVIGPRGKKISTGERQRICLARAFLKKAPILILDEPFANLDKISKKEILKVVANVKKEITTIIISHQPIETELLDRCFQIRPLEKGIVEMDKPT